jgi:hypothetical protein
MAFSKFTFKISLNCITIETRVASVFKANENLLPGDADAKRKYDNAINTL